MVIPPNDRESGKYFKSIGELNRTLALKDLSMGKSSDYKIPIKNKSTFLRPALSTIISNVF